MKLIVLLRGINVGGAKKLPMADLRELLEEIGFSEVQTYIQSGNVILNSEKSISETERFIQEGIQNKFGFEVTVITFSAEYLNNVLADNPFHEKPDVYFSLLNQQPEPSALDDLNKLRCETDQYAVGDKVIYVWCTEGYRNTKLDNNTLERKLKVTATTRNLNTMMKLKELTQ